MTALPPVLPLAQELAQRYDALRRYARRHATPTLEVDDLMQDLWLRLAHCDPACPAVGDPEAYLCRALDNLVVDRHRRLAAHGRHLDAQATAEDLASPAPSPFRLAAGRQGYDLLQRAITQLPPKCRAVFLLYRGRDMTMNQIAEQLGISPRTVENHLAHATQHCRRCLRGAGFLP